MAEAVFCQITGRTISTEMCIDLQHSHEPEACFGCGACSRLCAKCRQRRPVGPEIGLCCICIGNQLDTERQFSRKMFERNCSGTVLCQIIEKKVSAEMCLATQGDSKCNQCLSPFRLCEQCGQHKTYYSEYGLCLTCALGRYASVWLKVSSEKLSEYGRIFGNPKTNPEPVVSLLDRSRELIRKSGHASTSFFWKQLQISLEKGKAILELLETEGTLGTKDRGRYGREVLVETSCPDCQQDPRNLVENFGSCEECEQGVAVMRLTRRGLCLKCARRLYATSWARVAACSPNHRAIEYELYREAAQLAVSGTHVGTRQLIRKMGIGYYVAKQLMTSLEVNGIVGPQPDCKRQLREVLVGEEVLESIPSRLPSLVALSQARPSSQCHKCRSVDQPCVRLRGSSYCVPCARKFFGRDWTKGLTNSLDRPAVMELLRKEALEAIAGKVIVSENLLSDTLKIGSRITHELMEWLVQQGAVSGYVMQCQSGRLVTGSLPTDDLSGIRHVSSGRAGSNDPLYQHAKLLVITTQRASEPFLVQKLHIGAKRAKQILGSLEREGIVTAPSVGHRRARTVVQQVQHTIADNRVAVLTQVVELLGGQGHLAGTLKEVIEDLKKLQRLQTEDGS